MLSLRYQRSSHGRCFTYVINVPFISPNPVTNCYHKFSPLGRGYGAWSTGQLLQVDYLKTQLGSEFNYKDVVDQNEMLSPTKLKSYAKDHGIDVKTLLEIGGNKPKNS